MRVRRPALSGAKPRVNQRALFDLGRRSRKSGAGEGARTLDPDLGKVVPKRCAGLPGFAFL